MVVKSRRSVSALRRGAQKESPIAGVRFKADRLMPKRDDLKTPPRGVQTPGGWKKNDEQGSPVSSAISTRQPLQSCFSVSPRIASRYRHVCMRITAERGARTKAHGSFSVNYENVCPTPAFGCGQRVPASTAFRNASVDASHSAFLASRRYDFALDARASFSSLLWAARALIVRSRAVVRKPSESNIGNSHKPTPQAYLFMPEVRGETELTSNPQDANVSCAGVSYAPRCHY